MIEFKFFSLQYVSLCLILQLVNGQKGGKVVEGSFVICKDDQNEPITTCTRCLWRPNCVWCPERRSPNRPAVGCIETGSYECRFPVISGKEDLVKVTRYEELRVGIQISPLEASIELNPTKNSLLQVEVALANNPVDIYFVMDLSKSMESHRDNLVKTTKRIAAKIQALTPNYRLGFGSFSDKPTAPFASEISYYLETGKPIPYAFHHELSLTNDAEYFQRKVANATVSANVDSPESGLDAIMQAIACKDIIGWRENVRKVIIFITDEGTHYAMDGLLGGIIQPADDKCHTVQNHNGRYEYSKQLTYDYPSFSKIREELRKRDMVVIFAVSQVMDAMYRRISIFIQGTENIGHLTSDPTSLERIVTEQYRDIKNRMIMRTLSPDGVIVGYTTDCKKQQLAEDDGLQICSELVENQLVHYNASFTTTENKCIDLNGADISASINLVGFPKDQLNLQLRCEECSCGQPEYRAPQCNFHGDLVCGGCECYQGFYGDDCGCNLEEEGDTALDLATKCIAPNGAIECSGHGDCRCGRCQCDEGYIPEFCDCHLNDCPKGHKGIICSGHGNCTCSGHGTVSSCFCESGWSGADCSCAMNSNLCKDPITNLECFGRGLCKCGQCECQEGYEGKVCQRDLTFSICTKLQPCVKASLFPDNPLVESWIDHCHEHTTYEGKNIYGSVLVDIGCLLTDEYLSNGMSKISNESFEMDYTDILHDVEDRLQACEMTIYKYMDQQKSLMADVGKNVIRRGDQIGLDVTGSVHLTSLKTMERCVMYHDGCEMTFYHNGLEDDSLFLSDQMISLVDKISTVYVIHRKVNNTEGDVSWSPIIRCTPFPVALVLGSTVGILFFLFLSLFVAAIVIINLNDLRAFRRYQAMKEANEAKLGHFENPLYEGKSQTFQNPQFIPEEY